MEGNEIRYTLALGAALLAALLGAQAAATRPAPRAPAAEVRDTAGVMEVRFLDVGQGDAALVRVGGRVVLVDTGPRDAVVRRLRELGVDHLDLLVVSHNHADHFGGADAVLDSFPVRSYLDNGRPANTAIQRRVLQRLEARGVTYLQPTRRTITLGDASLRVLPPPRRVTGDEQNNRSVGLLLERGRFRALFPGDAEEAGIAFRLRRDTLPDVDLLKASHHGSRNGVTAAWLARLRPEVVVVSAGARNVYGHPHREALRRYCAGGRTLLRTDLAGEVVVRVDSAGRYTLRAEGDSLAASPARREAACSTPGVPPAARARRTAAYSYSPSTRPAERSRP